MERTRKTLYVPACYLTGGGLGMLLMPELALKLMLSNGEYTPAMTRFAGVLTLGLGVLVIQTIRHKLEPLYPTLIGVRAFFCTCYAVLFMQTRDPFFLGLLGLVGFGAMLTTIQFLRERRA